MAPPDFPKILLPGQSERMIAIRTFHCLRFITPGSGKQCLPYPSGLSVIPLALPMNLLVAQVSKPAVSPTSKSAGTRRCTRSGFGNPRHSRLGSLRYAPAPVQGSNARKIFRGILIPPLSSLGGREGEKWCVYPSTPACGRHSDFELRASFGIRHSDFGFPVALQLAARPLSGLIPPA